jgi:hypothetical protein
MEVFSRIDNATPPICGMHFTPKGLNRGHFLDNFRLRPQHFAQSESIFNFKRMEILRADMATTLRVGLLRKEDLDGLT